MTHAAAMCAVVMRRLGYRECRQKKNSHLKLSHLVTSLPPPQASRVIIEKYYSRLTLDFATNKRIAEDVAIIPSKRLRNKIAGFTT